jgi:hypothetical protein
MLAMYVCELAWTGNWVGSSTRVFHGLSAGKMEQPPMTGDEPEAPPVAPPLPLDVPPPELPLLPPLPLLLVPPPPVLPPLELPLGAPPLPPPLLPPLPPPMPPPAPGLPLPLVEPPLLPELPPELLDPLPPLSPAPLEAPLEPPGVDQGSVVFELAQATAAAQVPTQSDTIRKRCMFGPPRLRRRRIASGGPADRCAWRAKIRDCKCAP